MSDSSTDRPWQLQFGASVRAGGEVQFRVWAPKATRVAVRILGDQTRTVPMTMTHPADSESGGVFEATLPNVSEGVDYFYVLDGDRGREENGERQRPDPVSRWQPKGVHGPSRIVDPSSFRWSDQNWAGIPLREFIIYELHTGTFTPDGTFESVIPRLPYLRDLGITAVEVMPVFYPRAPETDTTCFARTTHTGSQRHGHRTRNSRCTAGQSQRARSRSYPA